MNDENKELTLPEIQQEALKVLIKFDSLCKEHDWSYFITYGTLLGAVRHKGFIPWDDDVDVQMPRKDFNDFSEWCQTNTEKIKPFKLCSRETVENYPFGISRFVNMDFKYETTGKGNLPFDIGVFIDVYPFDNYCNNKREGTKLQKKIAKINKIVPVFYTAECAGGMLRTFIKNVLHVWLKITKPKNYPSLANKKIIKIINKYTSDSDIFIGCPSWTSGCFQYEKKWFSESVELSFSGYNFLAPKDYDSFLTCLYGDYMKLPSEEQRVPYHEYKIFPRNS